MASAAAIQSEFIARGMGLSTPLIGAIAGHLDRLHVGIVERAMMLITEFVGRTGDLTPAELARAARSRLENFATMLLGAIPPAGFPDQAQRVRAQHAAIFQQRLEGALRDIEIGFVGGRNVVVPEPTVLNNFKIDNSVVGAINTGNVKSIDVSLTNLHNAGRDEVRDALKALTEAILCEMTMNDTIKNELVEQVAFLSEQAVMATKDRKPGLIKATFGALTQAAGTVSALAGAWQAAAPILKGVFGL